MTTEVVIVKCAGCGAVLGRDLPSPAALAHIETCEKHPLAIRLGEIRNALRLYEEGALNLGDVQTLATARTP